MTDLDVFFHVHMVKVLPHPTHITPVEIPFTFPVSQSFRVYDIHVVHLLYSYYLHVLFNFVDFQLCGAKKISKSNKPRRAMASQPNLGHEHKQIPDFVACHCYCFSMVWSKSAKSQTIWEPPKVKRQGESPSFPYGSLNHPDTKVPIVPFSHLFCPKYGNIYLRKIFKAFLWVKI